MPFFREMISEQTACARQSAANAHRTGCTLVIPLVYLYFNEFQNEFQTFFLESFQYSAAMMSTHLSMPITPLSSVK